MKLFFETAHQNELFLFAVPLGFWIGLFLDGLHHRPWLRFVLDIGILVFAGVCVTGFLLVFQDSRLRVYHLLGILCGALLYVCGVGRIRQLIRMRWKNVQAGIFDFSIEKK